VIEASGSGRRSRAVGSWRPREVAGTCSRADGHAGRDRRAAEALLRFSLCTAVAAHPLVLGCGRRGRARHAPPRLQTNQVAAIGLIESGLDEGRKRIQRFLRVPPLGAQFDFPGRRRSGSGRRGRGPAGQAAGRVRALRSPRREAGRLTARPQDVALIALHATIPIRSHLSKRLIQLREMLVADAARILHRPDYIPQRVGLPKQGQTGPHPDHSHGRSSRVSPIFDRRFRVVSVSEPLSAWNAARISGAPTRLSG